MEGTRPKSSSSTTGMRVALNRRFPDHVAVVEELIKDCEKFRELCEDYLECGKVLGRLEELGETTRRQFEEYEDLRACLEQELLESIEDQAICPHCRRKHGGKAVDP